MSAIKLIMFLFPFIKEMILGEKSIKEALKTNKMRVFLIGAILLSIFLNFFTIPKLIKISADYVMLDRKYTALDAKYNAVLEETKARPHSPKPTQAPEKKKEEPQPADPQAMYPPYEPVPTPQEDRRLPADLPPDNKRQERRPRAEAKHRVDRGNDPQATLRYKEWKQSFDDIRARQQEEERRDEDRYTRPGPVEDVYRHN